MTKAWQVSEKEECNDERHIFGPTKVLLLPPRRFGLLVPVDRWREPQL
jgi:hypothetical protein